jgi:aspartyl-tRNA(Asn)/glutamyl-tRNA(Gln) amidotransferase subunit B
VQGGWLEFYTEDKNTGQFEPSKVQLTRAHLETDAAKLIHAGGKTMVDFNRSGSPLIEVVTEPQLRSSAEAIAFVNELQLLARRINISDADMEKGQMRFDCNLSLQNDEQKQKNELPKYKVEVKNINSVRALGRAIEHEIIRQKEMLEKGEAPIQETRGWRDDLNKSESQRTKEDAHDYRYFPEPDLPIVQIRPQDVPQLEDLPELPNHQRQRYLDMGLSHQTANTFVTQIEVGNFFDEVIGTSSEIDDLRKTIANIITVNLIATSTKLEKPISDLVSAKNLVALARLFADKKINNQAVQTTLEVLQENPDYEAEEVVATRGLMQVTDDTALGAFVDVVIENNPQVVEQLKSGKTQALDFLVGQCMKESRGKGNPQKFREILQQRLSSNNQ